jgi:UDP-N-acetylmuramate dehydrogenase
MIKHFKNEPLVNHTTFKIGGPVSILSIPANKNELLEEINYCIQNGIKYRILGNGSNILVVDKGLKGMVIKNTEALNYIHKKGNKIVIGSSVTLSKFVNYCVENNLEGLEYLSSVPGTIGGAIYMNAGRGPNVDCSISNKLKSVEIFDGQKIINLSTEDLGFSYRKSIFHKRKDWTILGATFILENQNKKVGRAKTTKRINQVSQREMWKYPSAGSIYKESNRIALRLLKGFRVGGCRFGLNTILNVNNGSSKDVLKLLKISQLLHFFFFKKPVLEIEIWK